MSKLNQQICIECLGLKTEMPLSESSLNCAFWEKQKDAITVFLKNKQLITHCFRFIAMPKIPYIVLPLPLKSDSLKYSLVFLIPGQRPSFLSDPASPLLVRTRTLHTPPFSPLCDLQCTTSVKVKLPTDQASVTSGLHLCPALRCQDKTSQPCWAISHPSNSTFNS